MGSDSGYRPPRATAMFLGDKGYLSTVPGIDWIASTTVAKGQIFSLVYQAQDDDAAQAFRKLYGASNSCAPIMPKGTVSCDDVDSATLRCTVSYRRWAATVISKTAPLLAQKCAAQYLILKNADK